ELHRPGYKSKSLRASLRAGQAVTLSGSDVSVDSASTGKLIITARTPADSKVVVRRADGAQTLVASGEVDLPEGEYALVATAPGYRELSKPVRITESAPAAVEVKLVPVAHALHMEGWEDAAGWKAESGWYSRKGGPFVLFKSVTSGAFH